MKKIVSYTLATTMATSTISSMNIKEVKAIENNLDVVSKANSVEVKVENTDKIENNDLSETIENNQVENSNNEVARPGTDENVESNNGESNDNQLNSGEQPESEPVEGSQGEGEESKSGDIDQSTDEDLKVDNSAATGKVVGKIEVDMNFSMPLKNKDDLDIDMVLTNTVKKNVEKLSVDESLGNGNLDSGVTYKVEKYNYKRQPIQDGEDIYYLKVTFENLELGNYSLSLNGAGYSQVNVNDINVTEYSQRVRLGNSYANIEEGYKAVFLVGDVNKDGVIDMKDYNLVFENLGSKEKDYDLNRDGSIDIVDLTYVNDNIGKTSQSAEIVQLEKIIKPENIEVKTNAKITGSIKDILTSSETTVSLSREDGQGPSEENPIKLDINLAGTNVETASATEGNSGSSIEMESIVIKAPATTNENAGVPSKGSIIYTDENGQEHIVPFSEETVARNAASGDVVISLGKQVAVKQISINVTANRGNKNISEIAKIEFLNNVYKEIPKPELNIPQIATVETCTNLHDERITLTWEPQPNVTSYEVMYQKLDSNGNVVSTKKLQTNKTSLNILDKAIKPYDIYRVSIQSLNGEWSSGYENAEKVPTAFDGKPDNVDENFNPVSSYYDSNQKGTVSEIQVIPLNSPEPPRNLKTEQGYKSFNVSWEQHSQARDFDIYYRKIGDTNKNWIKANENNIEVTENSEQVTNPDKSKLVRSHSYIVNGLEDNASYEVRVTATNHLGTSKMSETYIASTTSVIPPVMPAYKLINRPTSENSIGTTNIIDVKNKNDADGWGSDGDLTYDTENALVDGDFTTSWKVNDWDTGATYGSNRGSEITFNDTYEIGVIGFAETLEKGYNMSVVRVKVTYWDENDTKKEIMSTSIQQKTSNGNKYYLVTLPEPIKAKKIKVDTSGYGGQKQTMSELKFYAYDSIAHDIGNLYEDDLRLVLKDSVEQKQLDELKNRLNTADPVSGEYHPDQQILLKELELAQKLFDDKKVSERITSLDANIRTDNVGPALGMQNSWQSLGSVARPGKDENNTSKQIAVYMGSTDPNTKVDIVFLQNYGQPGQYISKVTTITPGRTEITIPEIISANVEKGGQVMARVTAGSTTAEVKVRLSGVTEIPHLNVNNLINDSSKESEVKALIKTYITSLRDHVNNIETHYPKEVTDTDNANNIYLYDKYTSILNTTDIEGDRFTLTLPATEILSGIESGLENNEQAQIERVYNALLAWEQEVQVAYAKKGVFEEVKDFNNNGTIDNEDNAYFNKHKAPLTRLNVKYQRMMMGAAAYASSHHIGVGFGASQYIQGVPYKFNENKEITNSNEAKLYGVLMGHEVGHAMDIGDRIYPETSNNLLAAITETMENEDSPYVGAFRNVYEKVTSNTIGLSTDRQVVWTMLWQPYLAYEDDDTYKMLFTDNDADLTNDSYFAKLNRAYREMTDEERANGDRDQWLIRMTSKVANKNLTKFYEAHGIIANATTLQYVSQFDEETRPIQYINDEARRQRMAGKADMAEGTKLTAQFVGNIKNGSYVDAKEVSINLSVDKSNDKILGYEIYRNGKPCGFIERDKENGITTYVDQVDNVNNRVVEYSAVAYDYNLKATEKVELGTVKIRHQGGIAKNRTILTTNTISVHEEHNDIHSCEGNEDLKFALDDDNSTVYEGRMLSKSEFNSSVHTTEMNPNNDAYLLLDTTEMKTLVGIKYTAPTTESGFIFKRNILKASALKKYRIEVSKDGANWTTVKEGILNVDPANPTSTIYFDAEGVTGGNQLASYNARYVKVTAVGSKEISASELEVLTPPGDNIEIGVADDNINYQHGIGILSEDYEYVPENPDTDEIERRVIPKDSIIITGEYRGNPAFNVPLVLNQNNEHIADKYHGILLAEVPDNGNLMEIAEGTWIYWVEPQDQTDFMKNNDKIFAELYRTDSADASEGGQRLVSDTFKIDVPDQLPSISLQGSSKLRSNNVKTIEIKDDVLSTVKENR